MFPGTYPETQVARGMCLDLLTEKVFETAFNSPLRLQEFSERQEGMAPQNREVLSPPKWVAGLLWVFSENHQNGMTLGFTRKTKQFVVFAIGFHRKTNPKKCRSSNSHVPRRHRSCA